MTNPVDPPLEDEASEDSTPVPQRVARLWKKKRPPSEGSLETSLKAMDVLYDADEPLTREELERRLIPRLDPYERAYLEAWARRDRKRQQDYRSRKINKAISSISELESSGSEIEGAVHHWITQVFVSRARTGRTLERTVDGKLRPGPGAPQVLRMDGRRVPYTSETRHELAQQDHDLHRQYLAEVEWSELLGRLPVSDPAARAQLLEILVRRLLIGPNKGKRRPLDERIVSPQLDRLVRLADTPAVQRKLLQRVLDAIWTASK